MEWLDEAYMTWRMHIYIIVLVIIVVVFERAFRQMTWRIVFRVVDKVDIGL